jgi:glucose-6-phosphate 1-dehydrogenase
MALQPVNMRFEYQEAFEAQRGTGYEVMLYSCMIGDATLFSRSDLVETAWRVAQPILDTWAETPADDFPNYPAGSWGPKAAADLLGRDGRSWVEVINRENFERVPILRGANSVFLRNLALTLKPASFASGESLIEKGDPGQEMYFLCRGQVEVVDGERRLATLGPGDFFGELALLYATPRTFSVRALGPCEAFVLSTGDFARLLEEQPTVARSIKEIARERYGGIDTPSR